MPSPRVVLVGPPGAGKTTVGTLLATAWGVPFQDTDQVIEQAEGRSISDIFVEDGEAHFRALEQAQVTRSLAEHDGVLALGGGAVMSPEVQQALVGHRVVFLDVAIADASARVGFDGSRPLLAVNPRATWTRMMNARRGTYQAVATHRVDTAGRTPQEVVDEIRALGEGRMTQPQVVDVGQEYSVHVGEGVLAELAGLVHPGRRVLVVHQPGREDLVRQVASVVEEAGGTAYPHPVPDAEAAKDVSVLAGAWAALGQAGFTRDDLVVGLGGGATTDLAGFVAATWLRGVDLVQLPTSLLGVVDAAVGGKTGINTAEGKNLVGAFHPPRAVLCDPAWLATMEQGDYCSGLAEIIKAGFIRDPEILELIEADPDAATRADAPVAVDLIARAVRVKSDVVAADLREASLREILNYGHTFAHAIEQVEGYSWRHGDAVAVGMVYVAELARAADLIDQDLLDRHRSVLTSVGLPTAYGGSSWERLRAAMGRDKKTRGSTLRFVVLEGLASPGRLEAPEEDLLERAYRAVSS